jgi:hypothetical protein
MVNKALGPGEMEMTKQAETKPNQVENSITLP